MDNTERAANAETAVVMAEALHEYAFDVTLTVALRVKATSFEEAAKMLKAELECADSNFGSWPDGSPITGEASLAVDKVTKDMLFEFDGDQAEVCRRCEAIEGEPEWGTVGDGYDGYCASCADKRQAAED